MLALDGRGCICTCCTCPIVDKRDRLYTLGGFPGNPGSRWLLLLVRASGLAGYTLYGSCAPAGSNRLFTQDGHGPDALGLAAPRRPFIVDWPCTEPSVQVTMSFTIRYRAPRARSLYKQDDGDPLVCLAPAFSSLPQRAAVACATYWSAAAGSTYCVACHLVREMAAVTQGCVLGWTRPSSPSPRWHAPSAGVYREGFEHICEQSTRQRKRRR